MTTESGRTSSGVRAARMEDVARLAQVSKMTVSRVLSGGQSVSPQTRQRVEEAMQQLRYSPNVAARALVSGRTRTIGVITFDTRQYGPGAALFGIEQAARADDYGISIATLPQLDQASMTAALTQFAQRSVDGVIAIVPHPSAGAALAQTHLPLPVVAVQGIGRGAVPSAAVDQHEGALQATRLLLDLGHVTVSHIAGPRDWFETDERIRGWRDALAERSAPTPRLLQGDWSAASGYAAAQDLLASRSGATAVFAANDQMALGVLHALHERGISVPEEVSLVGFDDIPEAAFFAPSLTTVRQDFDEMGRRGLRLLLDRIDGQDVSIEPHLVPPQLIRRASTGMAPGADDTPAGDPREVAS